MSGRERLLAALGRVRASARATDIAGQLWRSHLSVAAVALCLLAGALTVNLFVAHVSVTVIEVSHRRALTTLQTLEGVQRSLAALRGWMSVPSAGFRHERASAWGDHVMPTFNAMIGAVEAGGDEEEITEVHALREGLIELRELQWYIEDVAHTPGNEPARALFDRQGRAIGHRAQELVQNLLALEGEVPMSPARAPVWMALSGLQTGLLSYERSLGDYLDGGRQKDKAALERARTRVLEEAEALRGAAGLLLETQRQRLERLDDQLATYVHLDRRVVALKSHQSQGIAQRLFTEEAAPLARDLTRRLARLSEGYRAHAEADARRLWNLSWAVTLAMVALVGVMFAAAWWLSQRGAERIAGPVRTLLRGTLVLAEGGLEGDLELRGADELQALTAAFNRMRVSLQVSERGLRERHAYNQALISSAMGGIVAMDRSGMVHTFNPAASRLLGIPPAQIVGQSVESILSEASVEVWRQRRRSLVRPGQEVDLAFSCRSGEALATRTSVGEMQLDGRSFVTWFIRPIELR